MFKVADFVGKGLDGTSLRHTVLSNNLANVNTPLFRRSDVDFSAFMAQESIKSHLSLYKTHNNHLYRSSDSSSRFGVYQDNSSVMRNDGNNVDAEREMVMLMENQLHYQAMADVLSRNLSLLRSVIAEGRR